jgi:arsenite-transporting ATPase
LRRPSKAKNINFQFIGGKGGVGKTTCAAITALQHPRTLLVTTDPASSLAAVLGVAIGPDPVSIRGTKHFFAAHVDGPRAFERWLEPRKPLLSQIAIRGTYLDEQDVGRLLKLSLPGIDEVIGLLEIVRMVRDSGDAFDRVVVDTAPTGHTLRLLASPALMGKVAALLDSLQAHHRAVVSALRGSYRADAADSLIVELDRDAEGLAALLRDRERTEVTWVTLPEPMALEESSDAIGALESSGIRVDRLIVNRLTAPPPQPCQWCETRRRFEARAVTPVARRFGGREILAMPELTREPRNLAALREAGQLMRAWDPSPMPGPLEKRVRASWRGQGDGGRDRSIAPISRPAKLLLFGGKGGVGKSTCAAAVALDLARTARVLLLSTDPAHSLGDVFGVPFGNEPRSVAGIPTLHVREIDAAAEMDRFRRQYVAAVDEAFSRIAKAAGSEQSAFREVIDLAPPGIDEVIAVADVADTIADPGSPHDVVVIDTAPTGHALRLLHTPAVLRDWTLALMSLLLKYRDIVGAGTLAALLVQLSKRLRGLQDILANPDRCRFVAVTRPAAVPGEETLELLRGLQPLGITVDTVIVNAAGAGTCLRCHAQARAQRTALVRLSQALGKGYVIIGAPAEMPPPHGVTRLVDWRAAWRAIS